MSVSPIATFVPELLVRDIASDSNNPPTWMLLFASLYTISIFVAFALAFIFVITLILYAITAYVGPTIFRTGPWRRNGLDEDPSFLAPYPIMTGYGRILSPFMTDLTAKVTKAVQVEPAAFTE